MVATQHVKFDTKTASLRRDVLLEVNSTFQKHYAVINY